MSTTEIRDTSTDNYFVLTQYDASNNLEVAVAQALVQSAYNYATIEPETGVYISPANDSSWNCLDISANFSDYINTSAISNYPAGTVTEYSVISSKLITSDVSTNSYTTNISSAACENNSYDFNLLPTSSSYYDSNYVITQSLIADCSDNVSGNYVTGTFDLSNSNVKIQYAMQSRWNTTIGPYTNGLNTVGEDPTAITQNVSFNTLEAFAEYGTGSTDASYVSYWFSCDNDGSLMPNIIDASYQPIENNLLVGVRDLSGVTLDVNNDVGIFRIQQPSNIITTEVTVDGAIPRTIDVSDLQNMPLFNGYGTLPLTVDSSKNLLPIPGVMTSVEFQTLVNEDVYNTVADEWTFTVDVSSNGGGYFMDASNQQLTSTLDNSNILDNPYYMENYVANDHTINVSNARITIVPDTDGNSTDASSIIVDLTAGETLLSNYAGQDGQIIINTNTINTRYILLNSVDLSGNFTPAIYYSNDGAPSLSQEEMDTAYFAGMWQKVAQQSSVTSSDYWLKASNNSIMTLYTDGGGIVDNSYDPVDFDYSFNNTLFGASNDIRLWEINGSNNVIVNPQSLFKDPSYSEVETGFSTAGSLTGLTDDVVYNTYRLLLTAKTKESINLHNAVTDVSGWLLSYSDPSMSYLYTSSDQAYSQVALPYNYGPSIIPAINAGTDVSYSYTYYTVLSAGNIGGLVDYVDISYTYNNSDHLITIPQTDIIRTYLTTDSSYVVIDPSAYSFTGSFFNKSAWELVQVSTVSTYNASFPANYGPFINIKLTVEDIIQNDSYYAIRNKATDKLAPHSALQFVNTLIPNLQVINETIEASEGNTLTISGVFSSDDLKPFMSITQGENVNNTWTDAGESINTDVYYGLKNVEYILDSSNTQLTTVIEYSKSNSENVFLNLLNYYIPFIYDQSGNVYILNSYTASASTITNNTDLSSNSYLGNTSYLSLTNAYSSVTNWSTTSYTLSIAHDVYTNSTVYTVKDLDNNTVFTIVAKDYVVFLGSFIVSYIPRDYYRVERLLGPSNLNNVYTETFVNTDYTGGKVNLSTTLQGVYISDVDGSLSSTYCPNLGSYQSFRVLGDFMTINEVGSVNPPDSTNELGTVYNTGSLDFQYTAVNGVYSAIFTFPKYRGYRSFGVDQYYTISRDATTVTFDVSGGSLSDLSDELTANMYYGQSFVVDNLTNDDDNLVANLNISGTFNYSILPAGSPLSYIVNVVGDQVNVAISNLNYIGDASNIVVDPGATPVVDPNTYSDSMTLKDYGQNDMYTFSGNWYLTDALMAIRPSRVKLYNEAYPYTTLEYAIKLFAQQIPVYKAVNTESDISFNWIGNPAIHGSQDPDLVPDSNDWVLHSTYSMAEMYNDGNGTGIEIGKKVVYQNPNLAIGFKLLYVVSAPPYYTFETMDTSNCPVIPYNYPLEYTDNQTVRYLPYINSSNGSLEDIFNPFSQTASFVDISNNTVTLSNDPLYLNNITFTLLSPPTMTNAFKIPVSTRYGIIVPGTNLIVSEYVGLYNSTNNGAHSNPIWQGPVTSIPSTPDITTNALLFRSRDASGGINFSALQYPADIGYLAGSEGYEQILKTDTSSNWYNIDFNMGNSSWFNDNVPITYFDANAHGIRPTLYTVVDINNPITQTNKRRVYKYTTSSSIDIDLSGTSVSGLQTFTLTFNARSYHDFDITMNTTFPSDSSDCWKYNTILNEQVIPNASIVWTTDASFSQTAYVSWAFGNSNTATKMLVDLFSVQNDQEKWVYIQLEPFMRYMNQFNMQVGSVAWDGSVTAPLISTRVVALAPQINEPILQNNTYSTQQYSESTL